MGIFVDNLQAGPNPAPSVASTGGGRGTPEGDPLGIYICGKYDALHSDRVNWDEYWDELSYYIIPRKNNVYGARTTGERYSQDTLFDNTSVHSNELLASALHSMLTNPSSMWFGFTTGDDALDLKEPVSKWLDKCARIMYSIFNNTNFHTQIHEYYTDLPSFGTGTLRIIDDDEDILRFEARPIYEHYIEDNHRGLVDTIYRKYKWTAHKIIQEFGKDNVPKWVLERASDNRSTEKLDIIQGIGPRKSQGLPKVLDKSTKPFYSVHVLYQTREVLRNSGFNENPYIVGRWTKLSNEVYGRGPGMKCLADIKMLNSMVRINLQAAQLMIAPPLQAPDSGVLLPIKTTPFGINIYRAGSRDRIEPLLTGGNPPFGEELAESVRQRIRNAFYLNQLQLSEQHPQMTATEVIQRTEEKLRLLGPILGRQHFEFLQPLVERCFNILSRKGVLPSPPGEISDRNITVRYTSKLAQAQKASEGDNFLRLMQMISPLLEAKPEIMDNFDGDKVLEFMANIFNVPKLIFNSKQDVIAIREDRSAQLEQQEQSMVQESDAKGFKEASQGAAALGQMTAPMGG